MRVWVLGSGSAGNAVLVESGGTRIIIDAGFPVRELAKRLAAIGVSGDSIEGAIVTHEHNDHVRGVCAAARRWKWAVYASTGTIAGYPLLKEICARPFVAGATLELGDLSVQTVRTPHDGTEPVAVVATARSTGTRAGIIYDNAYITLCGGLQPLEAKLVEIIGAQRRAEEENDSKCRQRLKKPN